jgi:hypothetical protein
MQEKIGKKIRVVADFNGGQVKPMIFKWQNRNYKVKSVAMSYQERDGASINYYYSVETDTGGVFKLRYNDQKLVWWLEEYWSE